MSRLRHEALIYGSDREFLDVVVPFLRDGVAAGERALLAVHPRLAELVSAALRDTTGVSFLDDGQYGHPLRTLRDNYAMIAGQVAAGATRIRMVGEVPDPVAAGAWDGWARYEASVNHFFAAFPVWSICVYDARTSPARVLADVERTHPRISTAGGRHRPSPRYREPGDFLADVAAGEADPLERTPPAVELTDPTPAAARQAVRAMLPTADLVQEQAENLAFAVSEGVVNALRHGRRPARVRAWVAPDRILVTVHDPGPGPVDPFVGLLPHVEGSGPGLGLWLAHQLCDRVTLATGPDGFTLRLVAGRPHPRRPG